jgi:hypothetical protein
MTKIVRAVSRGLLWAGVVLGFASSSLAATAGEPAAPMSAAAVCPATPGPSDTSLIALPLPETGVPGALPVTKSYCPEPNWFLECDACDQWCAVPLGCSSICGAENGGAGHYCTCTLQ